MLLRLILPFQAFFDLVVAHTQRIEAVAPRCSGFRRDGDAAKTSIFTSPLKDELLGPETTSELSSPKMLQLLHSWGSVPVCSRFRGVPGVLRTLTLRAKLSILKHYYGVAPLQPSELGRVERESDLRSVSEIH
jgi:hypothetical protein